VVSQVCQFVCLGSITLAHNPEADHRSNRTIIGLNLLNGEGVGAGGEELENPGEVINPMFDGWANTLAGNKTTIDKMKNIITLSIIFSVP
jgi:hypothetical protein